MYRRSLRQSLAQKRFLKVGLRLHVVTQRWAIASRSLLWWWAQTALVQLSSAVVLPRIARCRLSTAKNPMSNYRVQCPNLNRYPESWNSYLPAHCHCSRLRTREEEFWQRRCSHRPTLEPEASAPSWGTRPAVPDLRAPLRGTWSEATTPCPTRRRPSVSRSDAGMDSPVPVQQNQENIHMYIYKRISFFSSSRRKLIPDRDIQERWLWSIRREISSALNRLILFIGSFSPARSGRLIYKDDLQPRHV